jgi:dihydroxyacetone kinase
MPGFSVTLLLLPPDDKSSATKEHLLDLLDAQAKTPAWTWTSSKPPGSSKQTPPSSSQLDPAKNNESGNKVSTSSGFVDAVRRACEALIHAEPEITRMDQVIALANSHTILWAHTFSRLQVTVTVVLHSSQGLKVCLSASPP